MQLILFVIFIVACDILFTVARQRDQQKRSLSINKTAAEITRERFLWSGAFFPLPSLEEVKSMVSTNDNFRQRVLAYVELTVLGIWTVILGSAYLDLNPRVVPKGHEFGMAIQSGQFWIQLKECGVCALWNGAIRGGYPAMAEIYGSFFHPIVAVSTLLFGVVNGIKISLIISLWLAGVAQWWIARELQFGWLPRMWSALIAIAGGHLAGRMEVGVFGLVLSTAMASLVFAGILHLENSRSTRSAILLGVLGSLLLTSGQGYIQVGLLAVLPAGLIFFLGERKRISGHVTLYVISALLALMLAAPLIIPIIHFGSNIAKEVDPSFGAAQPLQFLVLNLVINDSQYLYTEILGKLPYPFLYALYIGWIPVLLAFFGLSKVTRKNWRVFSFMTAGSLLAFLSASDLVLVPLVKIFPAIAGLREPPLFAGLAIPLLLGLSAYGLEQIIILPWTEPQVAPRVRHKWLVSLPFPLRWILIIPALILSLKSVYDFSSKWLDVETRSQGFFDILNGLKTDSSQWTNPPFGEQKFVEPAIDMGLKLSPGVIPWNWKGRDIPMPKFVLTRDSAPPEYTIYIGELYGFYLFENPNEEYAFISSNGVLTPCKAKSTSGLISVSCDTDTPGLLTIKENYWSGWRAWVDGQEINIESGQWLQVKALQGNHTYTFRYLPWDVPVGLIIFFVGIIISLLLWTRPNQGLMDQFAHSEKPQEDAHENLPDEKTENIHNKRKKSVRISK